MNDPLMSELHFHEYLRSKLAEEFPDADEESLNDTLEGMTDLHEILAAVIRSQQEDRVLSNALKARAEEMQGRLKRLEHRVDTKRELVATVMERAQIDKIVESDFTVSIRNTPQPLVITEETSVPEEYWKPQPAKLDRKRLLECVKSGQQIAGVCLGNGGRTISVRVK